MSKDKVLRWGILGTGWVAQRFISDLGQVPGAEVSAVASRSLDRARLIGERWGVPHVYGCYEELVGADTCDVVYVATEHDEHAHFATLALMNDKPVLCEKPFATTLLEAERVVEIARARGRFCMEAMWSRFLPGTIEAKRRIDRGDIGEPRILTTDFGVPVPVSADSRFFDPQRGGGALLDRGVYGLSLAIWLFGRPLSVLAVADMDVRGVDRSSSALLRFKEDCMAVVTASLVAYSANEAVIAGSRGRVVLKEPFYRPERIHVGMGPRPRGGYRLDLPRSAMARQVRGVLETVKPFVPTWMRRDSLVRRPICGYGYGYEACEVVRCLRQGLLESPSMPLHDTLVVVETMDRIREQFPRAPEPSE